VAAGLAVLWWHFAPKPRAAGGPATHGLETEQMLDSLQACVGAREWDRALEWARAINLSRPGTASLLLDEGLAWHNYAQGGSHRWPGRSASRTSLDRIELEERAAAMFDSASAVARTDVEWANIQRWRGLQYEVLGLPLDAIQAYGEALRRVPDYKPARDRLVWMQRLLVRPTNPASVTAKDAEPRR
jgi:tetratricopeptide (TPR) repeat protein